MHARSELAAASPVNLVKEGAPLLLCIHSVNDELVLPEQSDLILHAYGEVGARAELASFSGPGNYHGIWEDGHGEVDTDKRILVPQVKLAVREFLKTV